jgi:predicted glutamine amidotransferase
MIGVVAGAETPLRTLLEPVLEPFRSLSAEHNHGWGSAAWSGGELTTTRDVQSALRSPAFDRTIATETDAAIVHLRMATDSLSVGLQNTHPFVADGMAFVHNGAFAPVAALDELIGPDLLATARGETDSERYFLLIRRLLEERGPIAAVTAAAAAIRERAMTFASLNCLLLTEKSLYAYAEEDPASEVSRRRGPDFFRLRYHAGAGRVLVGSSGIPQPDGDWQVVPYGQVLEVDRESLRVTLHNG